jgi:hypothetical protein
LEENTASDFIVKYVKHGISIKAASLPPGFRLTFSLAYSALKKDAIRSSQMLVDFQQSAWRYIPDDSVPLI